jgi:hypothetical protein
MRDIRVSIEVVAINEAITRLPLDIGTQARPEFLRFKF